MGDKYDSILKEEKKYEEYTPTHTIFKKFMFFGFLLVIVVIIISYFIYYNTFLNGETILLNNFFKLVDDYSITLNGIDNNYNFGGNYMLDGEVKYDNNEYKYTFIGDNNKIKRTFTNGNNSVSFYYDGDSSYIKLSNLDKYISTSNELLSLDTYKKDYDILSSNIFNYFNYILFEDSIMNTYNRLYTFSNKEKVISDIRNNFLDLVSDNKYNKKFYFYNGRPVVKIDLILDTKDLNKILSNGDNNLLIKDDYNVIITTRNDAVMNDIKNIKIIINNKTSGNREVIYYDGDDLNYTNKDGVKYKYDLNNNSDKFNLKIYKDDILYCALEGEKDNDKYIYNYQFIDKLERYTLEVMYDKSKYNYNLVSNINNKSKTISISGEYFDDGAISEGELDVSMYRDIDDRYRDIINNSLINFLK